MNRTPRVSVIVPVYNTAAYITMCLESLLKQTLTDIEIIVIDDGSTDDSGDLIKDFADRDERILFRSKDNSGLADTYNMGMELASGDYLAFIDSDDWIDAGALEKLYKHARDKSADLVLFRYRIFYEEDERVLETKPLAGVLKNEGEAMTLDAYPRLINISTSSCVKLFSRKLIQKHHITYPSGLRYEDLPFCYMAYYHAATISLFDESLYNYRIRPHSITSSSSEALFDHFKIFSIADDFFSRQRVAEPVMACYAQKKASVLFLSYRRINSSHKKTFYARIQEAMGPASKEQIQGLFTRMQLQCLLQGNYFLFRVVNWLQYGVQQKLISWIKS